MSENTITVTEAARNFADCVNRAHYQNQSFVLLKNGVPFARLVPAGEPICHGSRCGAEFAAFCLQGQHDGFLNFLNSRYRDAIDTGS